MVPVSDVDRAKEFYADKLGFNVDHDTTAVSEDARVVQLTPLIGLLDRARQGDRGGDATRLRSRAFSSSCPTSMRRGRS